MHEKRKTPFSLQPKAYVVMDRILDFGLLETLEAHSRQNSDFARILAFRRKCLPVRAIMFTTPDFSYTN